MNKTAAKSRAAEMLGELADETPASIEGRDLTFAQVADFSVREHQCRHG